MHFLIQKDNEKYNFETFLLKSILDRNKYLHTYEEIEIDDFFEYEDTDDDFEMFTTPKKVFKNASNFQDYYKSAIPIGNIPFVEAWLKIFHNIDRENPIEVPPILRTDEFLKRKYSIVKGKDVPKSGYYFFKDVSELKKFTYSGELEYLELDRVMNNKKDSFIDNSLKLDVNHLYQVSQVVNVLSEWRVYIIGGKIENITNYDGDITIFPDIDLIKKANAIYSTVKDYPKSYSMDIMVTPKGSAITEIHNYTSLGHYSSLWGDNLAYAYRDGIDYLINYNTPITEFSNF